jgi:AraC-like DNA-binding protein
MKVKLKEQSLEQELYSSSINSRANYRTATLPLSSSLKNLSISELRFNGLNYILMSLEAERSTVLNLAYTQPGYWLCIALEGECKLVENKNKSYLSAYQYICWPMQESVEVKVASSNKLLFIAIDSERAEGLTIYDNAPRKLNPIMHSILKEIRLCSEECPIKCIFIESKILSLLHLIFESLQIKKVKEVVGVGLSPEDIQKLRAAKVYIVQNIDKNYTLIELAHQVGLNDFKLKKGFKQLFGSTVFTYRHTMRMEKAKDMLQSGFQVNQVSEEIGYKHPHHFSVAFKGYFNVLPSMIKVSP